MSRYVTTVTHCIGVKVSCGFVTRDLCDTGIAIKRVIMRGSARNTNYFVVGFPRLLVAKFEARARALRMAKMKVGKQTIPEPKAFTPKCPEIPVLDDYRGRFSDEHWGKWPSYRPNDWTPDSWVSGDKLVSEARQVKLDDMTNVFRAAEIVAGAETGVRGAGRLPTCGRNQESAYTHGKLLSDALGAWVKAGLMAGPYEREELPWALVKVSPMSIQLKPNGAGRYEV